MIHCSQKPIEKPASIFGNVYRIDSVAGQEHFSDPFFVVITKDSLFSAFGYWDYSYPYETELCIDDSLHVFGPQKEKYELTPAKESVWIKLPIGKRILYSRTSVNYDSAYKHLRIIRTQESLLLGAWKFVPEKSQVKNMGLKGFDILTCKLDDSSILRFTRGYEHKLVQIENLVNNKLDICLRRDFRMNGNEVLIFDYDVFTPWTILKLDSKGLILQGPGDVLYFEKRD